MFTNIHYTHTSVGQYSIYTCTVLSVETKTIYIIYAKTYSRLLFSGKTWKDATACFKGEKKFTSIQSTYMYRLS